MIRDVLAIETGDLVFPIIFEVATSREYHAARELYGARFKHISLAISDIDTKFYLISTICRYISIIIRNYSGTLAPINWSRYFIFINNLSIYKSVQQQVLKLFFHDTINIQVPG